MGLSLAYVGVQFVDADGDGRPALMVTTPQMGQAGYEESEDTQMDIVLSGKSPSRVFFLAIGLLLIGVCAACSATRGVGVADDGIASDGAPILQEIDFTTFEWQLGQTGREFQRLLLDLEFRHALSAEEIATIDVALSTWPDSLREIPLPWIEALLAGEEIPLLGLCRVLSLRDYPVSMDELARILTGLANTASSSAITHLDLGGLGLGPELAELVAESDLATELVYLDISGNPIGPTGLLSMVESDGFERLRFLNLADTRIHWAGAELLSREDSALHGLVELDLSSLNLPFDRVGELLQSESLRGVTHLRADNWPIDLRTVESFISRGGLRGLVSLSLANTRLSDQAFALLVRSAGFGSIEYFNVTNNPLTSEAAAELAFSPFVGRLRSLSLSQTNMSPRGMTLIARSRALSGLVHLDVSFTNIGATGVEALSRSRQLESLRSLDLSGVRFSQWNHSSAAHPSHFEVLCHLNIAGADLGDGGFQERFEGIRFGQLRWLDLSLTEIGDEDAQWLSHANDLGLSNLEVLVLSRNLLGDEGLRAISSSDRWRNLRLLDVSDNLLTDVSLSALSGSSSVLHLHVVDLRGNYFGETSISDFREAQSLESGRFPEVFIDARPSEAAINDDEMDSEVSDSPLIRSTGRSDGFRSGFPRPPDLGTIRELRFDDEWWLESLCE